MQYNAIEVDVACWSRAGPVPEEPQAYTYDHTGLLHLQTSSSQPAHVEVVMATVVDGEGLEYRRTIEEPVDLWGHIEEPSVDMVVPGVLAEQGLGKMDSEEPSVDMTAPDVFAGQDAGETDSQEPAVDMSALAAREAWKAPPPAPPSAGLAPRLWLGGTSESMVLVSHHTSKFQAKLVCRHAVFCCWIHSVGIAEFACATCLFSTSRASPYYGHPSPSPSPSQMMQASLSWPEKRRHGKQQKSCGVRRRSKHVNWPDWRRMFFRMSPRISPRTAL